MLLLSLVEDVEFVREVVHRERTINSVIKVDLADVLANNRSLGICEVGKIQGENFVDVIRIVFRKIVCGFSLENQKPAPDHLGLLDAEGFASADQTAGQLRLALALDKVEQADSDEAFEIIVGIACQQHHALLHHEPLVKILDCNREERLELELDFLVLPRLDVFGRQVSQRLVIPVENFQLWQVANHL